jgi:hypothetical protein
VQAADDARAAQRLLLAIFAAQRHQPRHLGFGDGDLLAAPIGERNIGNLAVGENGHHGLPKGGGERAAQGRDKAPRAAYSSAIEMGQDGETRG